MKSSRRTAIPAATKEGLYRELDGLCMICGGYRTHRHHITPVAALGGHHPLGELTTVTPDCHDILTYCEPLIPQIAQKSIRRAASEVVADMRTVRQLLYQCQPEQAVMLYVRRLHGRLVTFSWYQKARGYLDQLDRLALPANVRSLLLLAQADFRQWIGEHLFAARITARLLRGPHALGPSGLSWLHEIHGRALSYLANGPNIAPRKARSRLHKAINSYHQSLECASDRLGAIRSFEASALMRLGRFEDAVDVCRRAILFHRSVGDIRGEEDNLDRLGSLYLQAGNPDGALRLLLPALGLAMQQNHNRGVAYRLRHIGMAFSGRREDDLALSALSLARSFAERFGDPNIVWIADAEDELRRRLGPRRFDRLHRSVTVGWPRACRRLAETVGPLVFPLQDAEVQGQ